MIYINYFLNIQKFNSNYFNLINFKKESNMLSTIKTISLHGLEGYLVDVQVDVSNGMPSWEIVRSTRHKRKRSKRKSKNCY